MSYEIQPTDFRKHRRFLEEAEREMFIDSGMAQRFETDKLQRMSNDSVNNCQNRVDRGQGTGFCAIEDDRPIGCVYANVNGLDRTAFVTCVYVVEKWRDHGVGRALMEQLLENLEEGAISDVGLAVTVTNERAQHLYASLGFEVKRHIMKRNVKRPTSTRGGIA